MVLDEFSCGAKASSNSALIRIAKGVFGLAGGKLAAAGRLRIDTPFGQLRGRAPALGIGSVALGAFTFALIRELQAGRADVAYLDYGTVDYNDLKHGVYEVILEGKMASRRTSSSSVTRQRPTSFATAHPATASKSLQTRQRRWRSTRGTILTPIRTIRRDSKMRLFNSGNTPITRSRNPIPGSTGSSTSTALLSSSSLAAAPPQQPNTAGGGGGNQHSSGGSGSGGSSNSSGQGGTQPTPVAHWQYDLSGLWSDPSKWSDSWAPVYGYSRDQSRSRHR